MGNNIQEARELVRRFKEAIDPYGLDDNDRDAQQASILHCELMQKTWSEDFYGLVLTPKFRERCLQKAEHYTNLITTIKSL